MSCYRGCNTPLQTGCTAVIPDTSWWHKCARWIQHYWGYKEETGPNENWKGGVYVQWSSSKITGMGR